MKILYVTDLNHIGPTSGFQMGPRPPMSWISTLSSFHCNYENLDQVPAGFDVAILGCIHGNVDVVGIDIIAKTRKVAKKLIFQHDGHHRLFYQHNDHLRNYMLQYIISNVDAILAHNELDKKYYESLYKKPTYIHRQLFLDVFPTIDVQNQKQGILLLSMGDKYGALDGYMLGLETSEKMFIPTAEDIQFPRLELIPVDFNYQTYSQKLSTFKLGINPTPLALGGSFPLQCAMVKTPCVGWNNSEPLTTCFPDLTAEYGDFDTLRNVIQKLLKEEDFYAEVVEKGRQIFLTEYSVETYLNQMSTIFNQVLKS